MRPLFRIALAVVAVLALEAISADSARAGMIFSSQFPGGVPVTVSYTRPDGTIANEGTQAAPFNVTPLDPSGPSFQAFCVSLAVQVGWGPDIRKATVVTPLSALTQTDFFASAWSDVGNRLAFLLENDYSRDNDLDHNAALQLAIWNMIDKNFSYTGGNSTVNGLYQNEILLTGYDSNLSYGGDRAKLLRIDPQGGAYQNLVTICPVPEPASLVMMTLGGVSLLGYAGYSRRGRKPNRPASA